MKKLILLLPLLLLMSCTTTGPLKVIETEYIPTELDLTDAIELLTDSRPETSPRFIDAPVPGSTDEEVMYYLAKVIEAYDNSLALWQDYAHDCEMLLMAIQETYGGNT